MSNSRKKYPSLKSDLFKLIKQLEANPLIGTLLGKDFYKIRLSISSKGKGKSGGARVITRADALNYARGYSQMWISLAIMGKVQFFMHH